MRVGGSFLAYRVRTKRFRVEAGGKKAFCGVGIAACGTGVSARIAVQSRRKEKE